MKFCLKKFFIALSSLCLRKKLYCIITFMKTISCINKIQIVIRVSATWFSTDKRWYVQAIKSRIIRRLLIQLTTFHKSFNNPRLLNFPLSIPNFKNQVPLLSILFLNAVRSTKYNSVGISESTSFATNGWLSRFRENCWTEDEMSFILLLQLQFLKNQIINVITFQIKFISCSLWFFLFWSAKP